MGARESRVKRPASTSEDDGEDSQDDSASSSSSPSSLEGQAVRRSSFLDRVVSLFQVQVDVDDTEDDVTPIPGLRCPEGHQMTGRIEREVCGACSTFCGHSKSCSGNCCCCMCACSGRCCTCCHRAPCMHCGREFHHDEAYYRCHECDLNCCLSCASTHGGLNEVLPGPGDVILAGPFLTVTHVIAVVSQMERADESSREALGFPRSAELFCCTTVETTPMYRQCLVGGGKMSDDDSASTSWYRAYTYYMRDREKGAVNLVGVRPWDSSDPPQAISPQPTLFLLHPFRGELSSHFNSLVFQQAVKFWEAHSRTYSFSTAVRLLFKERSNFHPEMFPTPDLRAALLKEVRERWKCKPICASVPVKIWQKYFELVRNVDSSREDKQVHPQVEAAIVRDIIRWMPVFSDATYPSVMVKVLGECGWTLRGDIQVVAQELTQDQEVELQRLPTYSSAHFESLDLDVLERRQSDLQQEFDNRFRVSPEFMGDQNLALDSSPMPVSM
eukprot:TRINITY_DN67053_c0_g1_i1.p1 TRINITY_DN67053_c0_g1~~TRINITY_DN67053_c0_g1_i1.p1  ORF type:complete len:518 (+),score=65.04 TRINITY_DN67053_c0_g1_i1:56-1555(+)